MSIEEPEEPLIEETEEVDNEVYGDGERIDWDKLRTIIHSRPKTLDQSAKLSEDDIMEILLQNNMSPELAEILSTMLFSVTGYLAKRKSYK